MQKLLRFGSVNRYEQNNENEICDEIESEEYTTQRRRLRFFGIKSHLNKFYENVSFRNIPSDEDDDDLLLPSGQRRMNRSRKITFWNTCLVCGCLTIIVGAILLAIGFGFSTHKIDVGFQEEMQIIDKSAVLFNHRLELFKISGLSMLAIGGFLLSMSLLLPSLIYSSTDDDDNDTDSNNSRITNIITSNSKLNNNQHNNNNNNNNDHNHDDGLLHDDASQQYRSSAAVDDNASSARLLLEHNNHKN